MADKNKRTARLQEPNEAKKRAREAERGKGTVTRDEESQRSDITVREGGGGRARKTGEFELSLIRDPLGAFERDYSESGRERTDKRPGIARFGSLLSPAILRPVPTAFASAFPRPERRAHRIFLGRARPGLYRPFRLFPHRLTVVHPPVDSLPA